MDRIQSATNASRLSLVTQYFLKGHTPVHFTLTLMGGGDMSSIFAYCQQVEASAGTVFNSFMSANK